MQQAVKVQACCSLLGAHQLNARTSASSYSLEIPHLTSV